MGSASERAGEFSGENWQPGSVYRVLVTTVKPGNVEILLGNRYLKANTELHFRSGDVIWLLLAEKDGARLVFRLTLPPSCGTEQSSAALQAEACATLLRAAALPAGAEQNQALLLLQQNSIGFDRSLIMQLSSLIGSLGYSSALACLPLLKRARKEGLAIPLALLPWLAQLSDAAESAAHPTRDSALSVTSASSAHQQSGGLDVVTRRVLVHEAASSSEELRKHVLLLLGRPGGGQYPGEADNLAAATIFFNALMSEQTTLLLPLRLLRRRCWLRMALHDLGQTHYERSWLLRLALCQPAPVRMELHLRGSEAAVQLNIPADQHPQEWQADIPELLAALQSALGVRVRHQLHLAPATVSAAQTAAISPAENSGVLFSTGLSPEGAAWHSYEGYEIASRIPLPAYRTAAAFLAACFRVQLAAEQPHEHAED